MIPKFKQSRLIKQTNSKIVLQTSANFFFLFLSKTLICVRCPQMTTNKLVTNKVFWI